MTFDTKRIPLFAGVAALVLVVAWYFLLLSPETKKIQAAHKAHAAAEQQAAQLQAQISQLQIWVKQIPQDTARLAQLESELPNNPQLDQALTLLHQAAASAGVEVTSLAPSTPAASTTGSSGSGQASSGPPSITLSLNVQGNGNQVKNFLAALAALPRTVVIDRFSVSSGSPATASISARIFYAGQPTP